MQKKKIYGREKDITQLNRQRDSNSTTRNKRTMLIAMYNIAMCAYDHIILYSYALVGNLLSFHSEKYWSTLQYFTCLWLTIMHKLLIIISYRMIIIFVCNNRDRQYIKYFISHQHHYIRH